MTRAELIRFSDAVGKSISEGGVVTAPLTKKQQAKLEELRRKQEEQRELASAEERCLR